MLQCAQFDFERLFLHSLPFFFFERMDFRSNKDKENKKKKRYNRECGSVDWPPCLSPPVTYSVYATGDISFFFSGDIKTMRRKQVPTNSEKTRKNDWKNFEGKPKNKLENNKIFFCQKSEFFSLISNRRTMLLRSICLCACFLLSCSIFFC